MYSEPGCLVANPHNVGPETLATYMKSSGFTWVATQVHDGITPLYEVDYVQNSWIARFRRTAPGIRVAAWGPVRVNPVEEAQLVEKLVQRYGVDGYVANAEYEYELTNDGLQDPTRFMRSDKFCSALGPATRSLFLAMTTFGQLNMHDLHYKPWYDAGFHVLPQAYVANQAILTPANAMASRTLKAPQHDGFVEWPAGRVHPMISTEELNRGRCPAGDHVVLLRIARDTQGMKGYSIFVGEGVYAHEWAVYGDYNKESPMDEPTELTVDEAVKAALKPLKAMEKVWDDKGQLHDATRVTLARRILTDSLSRPQALTANELRTIKDALDVMGVPR